MIPLMRQTAIAPFTLPDSIAGGKPTQGRALVYWITPGYAEALGLRLHEGRFFVDADARAGTLATIVNQEFVRQHLAARQVVGLRIPNLVGQDQGVTAEIVGVVGNVLKDGNDRQPQPELYFVHGSHGQRIDSQVNLVIRTTGNPAALAQDVRGLVQQVEREAVVDRIEPLTTSVAASLDAPTVRGHGGGRLRHAWRWCWPRSGLYGVMSYSVSQRVRELGIRAALGAQRGDLVGLVLREGLSVTCAGIALGVLGRQPVDAPHAGSAVRRHAARRRRLHGGTGDSHRGVGRRMPRAGVARGGDRPGDDAARCSYFASGSSTTFT